MATPQTQPTALVTAPADVDVLTEKVATTSLSSDPSSSTATIQSIPQGPISTPLPFPLPECKPEVRPDLTEDQKKKYDELLKIVSAWTGIPKTSAKGAEEDPVNDEDRLFLTRECLLRYLRAVSWASADAAAKRLLATLTWRREYGAGKFTSDYVSVENETGKQVIFGYDNNGRPCLYMDPGKQNTAKSDRQLHHLVYMLDRAIDMMGPGQETSALLISFKGSSNSSSPSVSQGKQTLDILQGHYPERLGRALVSNLPWYITTFFKLISPFIDPVTKSKMKFNEPLVNHVPPEQLQKDYGGKAQFTYKHDLYWPALTALTDQRRRDYRGRWEKAGKQIGESEYYLKGGPGKSLNGEYSGTDFPEGAFNR